MQKKIVSVSILSRSSHFCFAKLTRPKYKYKVQVGHNNNKNKYAFVEFGGEADYAGRGRLRKCDQGYSVMGPMY